MLTRSPLGGRHGTVGIRKTGTCSETSLVTVTIACVLTHYGCHAQNAAPCTDPNCGGHGTCRDGSCACDGGYSGSACETHDACFGMQCGQHGNCQDGVCACDDGYSGNECQTFDPCWNVNCGDPSHGTCRNGVCQCSAGYTGTPCAPVECVPVLSDPAHGAVDVTNNGVFPATARFSCNSGYVRLGSEMLSCQTTGSWSGSAPTCAETCATSPCQNGARCDDGGGARLFRCTCPEPAAWEGDRCETDINECNAGSGGCDALQGVPLTRCSNSQGSYDCGTCDESQFASTVPVGGEGASMVSCCNAPEAAGQHHLPCDSSDGGCDFGNGTFSISLGCIGPADASASVPSLQTQVAMSGEPVDIQLDPRDVHNRATLLSRDGGAFQSDRGLAQEMSVVVYTDEGSTVCTSPSATCPVGQCQNGGRCVPSLDGTPSCMCPPGTTGPSCETIEDGCADDPCGDAGECVPGIAGGHCCICPEGVGGLRCEFTNICENSQLEDICCTGGRCAGSQDVMHFCSPECAAIAVPFLKMCQESNAQSSLSVEAQRDRYKRVAESLHGLCGDPEELSGGFVCRSEDPCSSSPCQNGGTCQSSGYGTYSCACDDAFHGSHCELSAPRCSSFTFLDSEHHMSRLYETYIAANYSFSVRLRDAELEQSPGLQLQTYPKPLNSSTSEIQLEYNVSEAGRVMSFWVTPMDEFFNVRDPIVFSNFATEMGTDVISTALTIDGRISRQDETGTIATMWEPRASSFLVSFLAKRSGEYGISVSIANALGLGDRVDFPVHVVQVVPGPYDQTKTLVDIPPTSMRAGQTTQINVTALDQYGNSRLNNDSLVAEVHPQLDEANLSWSFFGQRFEVDFMSNKSVQFTLSISLGGYPLPSSPYSISIEQGPVDLDRSSVTSCSGTSECRKFGDIRSTMPGHLNSVGVVVRDTFGNVRDNLDTVLVEIIPAHGHGNNITESAVNWDYTTELYNVTFIMHSETEYAYSVDLLIRPRRTDDIQLLSTSEYHYAFHSNLNGTACTINDCSHALAKESLTDGWSAKDQCRSAGCSYRAAQTETVVLVVDEVTKASYQMSSLSPSLQIEQRCEQFVLSQFYWKGAGFCSTSAQGATSTVLPQQSNDDSTFLIQFNIEVPGLYTLRLSLSTTDGTVWIGPEVQIDVQPGLPSVETATMLSQSTSAPSATVAGNSISFSLQVFDANSNPRFGLDEVHASLRLASLAEMNDVNSEPLQPSNSGTEQVIGTERIAEHMGIESNVARPYDQGNEYSFNFTIEKQGVYALTVKICPGDALDLCNASAAAIRVAEPLVFTVCQPNSVIENFNDPNGMALGSRLHECACDAGFYGDHGGYPRGCLPCDQGAYTDTIGSNICHDCQAGKSCDCTDFTSKVECGAGTEAACTQCLPCRVGEYQDLEGQGRCKSCSTGFQCNVEAMTFPIAEKGYWISSNGRLTVHDCARQGNMPLACPGGDTSLFDSHQYCYLSQYVELPDECKPVVGASCTDGYWGEGCSQCCKFGIQECAYLQDKMHPDGRPYVSQWYKVESDGQCYECPEQSVFQLFVFFLVIAMFVTEKVLEFAEVAKLSGSLVGPIVSLINFFQMCDLFKTISLPWPASLKWFVENVLSLFNFNLHMLHLHPECQLSLTYTDKWMLKMASPLLLVMLMGIQYSLRYCLYLLASGNLTIAVARKCKIQHKRIGVADTDIMDAAIGSTDTTTNPLGGAIGTGGFASTSSTRSVSETIRASDSQDDDTHVVPFDDEAEPEDSYEEEGNPLYGTVALGELGELQDEEPQHNYVCNFGPRFDSCLERCGLVEPDRDKKHSVCSLSYMISTALASVGVWIFNGEALGTFDAQATFDPDRHIKTTSLLSFNQGFAEACICAVTLSMLRVVYFWWRFKRHHAKVRQACRVAATRRVKRIEVLNQRVPRVPCRTLEDFGLSFGYRLQHKRFDKKRVPLLAIYVKTKSLEARDLNNMSMLNVGQRVVSILDGHCQCTSPQSCTCQQARLYTDISEQYAEEPEKWDRIKDVNEQVYRRGDDIDEDLADIMEVLDQESHGIVRIKRPFSLRLATNQRTATSMLFRVLNPARMALQIVVTLMMACLTLLCVISDNETAMRSMLGCALVTILCVCDWIIFERQTGTLKSLLRCRQQKQQQPMAAKTASIEARAARFSKGATTVCLFIVGSSFWWEVFFKATALLDELQSWAFDEVISISQNATNSTLLVQAKQEQHNSGAEDLLRYIGMLMMMLFAFRKCSGDTLQNLWDSMASFNSKEKLAEMQFVAMEFLLVGYVMLVSAATQPMACHEDLDSVVKMSADSSIDCDFCSEKPNANLAMHSLDGQTAHTYGWLWKCALFATLLYSVGVPLFFFFTIWRYVGSNQLHTKQYLQHYGFLTSKFRDRWYFWEIGILLRKMLHASISSHAAHRPVRQGLLNLIIVFVSISAHCYCLPFVNNDANVAEFLTLSNTFFMLLIGLGSGEDGTDKGLSESDAHEWIQQIYWIILAVFCTAFTAITLGIIFKRLNSLMYDLSNEGVEENQYLDEDMAEILHKSKVESAILWATKTRHMARSEDGDTREDAKQALNRVQLLFADIKNYRNRVSWNDAAKGRREGNIDRWERRRLDRYFRDIDRSTFYMYLAHAAKLDQEDQDNLAQLQGTAFAVEPTGLYGCRLDTLEGFLRGLHACRMERTTWPKASKVLKAALSLSPDDAWKASDKVWHPLDPTLGNRDNQTRCHTCMSKFKIWWNKSEARRHLVDFEQESETPPTLLVNRQQLAGNSTDGRGNTTLKVKGKPDKPIRGCNTWKGRLCWSLATAGAVVLLAVLIDLYLAPRRCNIWDDNEEACLQAQIAGQRCHWVTPARLNQSKVERGWCDSDGLVAEFERCAAAPIAMEQSCRRTESFDNRHVVIDARSGSAPGAQVQASCDRGFIQLRGSTTFTCLNGHWIGDMVCASCDPLPNCKAGNTRCESSVQTCVTTPGAPEVNPCEDGFECTDADCTACRVTSCGEYHGPEHSMVVCNSTAVGGACTVECSGPGYISHGDGQVAICQSDGTWDDSAVSCSGRSCPPDETPLAHSTTRCSDHTYGGPPCEFQCEDGFEPQGTRVCSVVNGALAMTGGECSAIIIPFDPCPAERRELLQDAVTRARELVERWAPDEVWTVMDSEHCHDVAALATSETQKWSWRLGLLDSEQGVTQRATGTSCISATEVDTGALPPLLPIPPPPPLPPPPTLPPFHCRDNATKQMFEDALRDSDQLVAKWTLPAAGQFDQTLSSRCAASNMAHETFWWWRHDTADSSGSGCVRQLDNHLGG